MSDGPAPAELAERKLVTALFCDLVESTSLGERLDPESVGRVQAAYFDRLRSVVEHHGGTVEKFIGDAVVAVFGVPVAHEDDAERAVRCALEMRAALAGLNDTLRPRFGVELAVRMGIDTGDAVVTGRDADAIATGDVLNTAARLEQAAGPGEILVGRDTMLLGRRGVVFEGPRHVAAKGKAEPVEAWTPVSVTTEQMGPLVPIVGRVAELEQLGAALERAIGADGTQVVLVLGEPGIGKSRLAAEFGARVAGRAAVLRGACRSYGEDTAWRPLAEVIRADAGIAESDPPDVAREKLQRRLEPRHAVDEARLVEAQLEPLIGVSRGGAGSAGEVLWAIRRFLEGLAQERPAVVVFDDLHWAGETLLETLEELVETIGPAPLVLLCQGRPELLERMSGVAATDRTSVLSLGALSEDEAAQMVAELEEALGHETLSHLDATILERSPAILEHAGGNPLFLEEVASMAVQGRDVGRIPRSIHALIEARLDLLAPDAKRVAQAAAVVGESFWIGAVGAALSNGDATPIASALRTLRTRGLIQEQPRGAFLGQRQFAFHHALIRDVAYGSLSKQLRADMHRRVAGWLTEFTSGRPELWRAVAHHHERSLALENEVAPLAPADPELTVSAASSLLAAGRWAQSNAALPEAIELLRRAADVSRGSPLEHLCSARLSFALAMAGEGEEAQPIAQRIPVDDEAPEAAAIAALALATVEKNRGNSPGIRAHAPTAVELARRAEAPEVEVQAVDALAWAAFWLAGGGPEYVQAQQMWERAAHLARTTGDLTLASRAKGYAGLAAAFLLDVASADRLAEEALGLAGAAGTMRAFVPAHTVGSRTRELQDRPEEAVERGREWFRLAWQAGERLDAVAASAFGLSAPLRHLGRLEEAWTALEEGLGISREMGGSAYEDTIRAERALILLAGNRVDEADGEVRRMAALVDLSDDQLHRYWAAAAAPVRAAQGRDQEAEELWRRAIGGIEKDWFVVEHAIAFGRFLLDRGRMEEARPLLAQLSSLLEGTGASLLERQVRQLTDRLTDT